MVNHNWTYEAFYNGQWRAIPVRHDRGNRLVRGYSSETGGLTPQTTEFVIDGTEDSYDPYDPGSILFDQVGRNFPIRIGHLPGRTTGVMADVTAQFTDTVVSGLHDADVGGTWVYGGTGGTPAASDWAQPGDGTATVNITSDTYIRAAYLPDVDQIEDCLIGVTWDCPTVTGNDLKPGGLLLRGQSSYDDSLSVSPTINSSGDVDLILQSPSGLPLGLLPSGVTHTAGTPLRTEALAYGQDVWMRVYDPSGPVPDWQVHLVDILTGYVRRGWVGIRASRVSGNTNGTGPQCTFSNFTVQVRNPRFIGEAASVRPMQDPGYSAGDGGDRWTEVSAAGALRRISQPGRPLRSALYQFISNATGALVYYPLEEQLGSTTPTDVLTGVSGRVSGSVAFGTDPDSAYGAESVATVDAGASLYLPMSVPVGVTDGWRMSWLAWWPTAPSSTVDLLDVAVAGGTAVRWRVQVSSSAVTMTGYTSTGTVADTATAGLGVDTTKPVIFTMEVAQNGGNVEWSLKWFQAGDDTVYWTTVQTFAATAGRPRQCTVAPTLQVNVGHLVFDSLSIDPYDLTAIADGYRGETVSERLVRLHRSAGISYQQNGNADHPLQQQLPGALVDLIAECTLADQGLLFELRSWSGMRYRALDDLYNQTAVLALDAKAGTELLGDGLVMVIDDLPTENDVTARSSAGEARAVLATGRMSTEDPPDGVGVAATSYDISSSSYRWTETWAQWRLTIGTVDEPRWPTITVDLDNAPDLFEQATLVEVGDVIEVSNVRNLGTLRLLVIGIDELCHNHIHRISYVCRPASPLTISTLDDSQLGLLDSSVSTLASAFVAGTDTSMSVASTGALWETGSVSYNVRVGGDVVAISAISGTSSPQTFTVSATLVSGVAKTCPAGSTVQLANPNHLGR